MSLQLVKASQYPSTTGAAPATAPPFFTSARAKMGRNEQRRQHQQGPGKSPSSTPR